MKHRLNPTATALLAAFAIPAALPQFTSAQAVATTLPEVKVEAEANNDFAPAQSTVGAKAPLALRDIAGSVTVINRAVLESQAATSMVEALRNVPGITISTGEGGNIGDNINLRGFSARTDMFIDGFRDRGQYSRDTFFLEAVEVLKGPSSMLFGRGSTGGVINQVSKKPGLKASSEASASIGTDDYYRATIDLNRPLSDTSALRVSAMASDIGSTRDVATARHIGVAPSLRLGIGTPTEISLSALIQRNRDLPDYGFPLLGTGPGKVAKPINAPGERFYGFTDDKNNQDVDVLTASVRHKLSPNVTLSNRTQFSQTETAASPTPLSAVTMVAPNSGTPSRDTPLGQLQAPYSTRDRVASDQTLFNQTDLIIKAVTGGVKHTITAGAEIGRDKFHNDVYTWAGLGNVNLGAPNYGPKPATATRTPGAVTDTSADTLAVYVNDQLELNKQWKLVGGLRWDRFSADYSTKTSPAASPVLRSRTDKMLSTRLGAIWQPSDTQSYYVSYGTSFNPSAEAMSLTAATEGLSPEKNRSLEAGAKLDLLDGNLTFNTAVFRVEKTDARTLDRATGLTTLDGNIRVQGMELGVVGRITPAWQVLAGYTWLDGKVVSSFDRTGSGTAASPYLYAQGKTLANTPEHSASLWSTYSVMGNWEAGGGVVYSSDRFVNNFESAQIDGYTRFDATVAYKQKNYDLRLHLQNVGDQRYFETASAGRATPAKGRTIIASVNYRF
ncbi:TonB-dependent receptor [Massilia glaciei]|uniref:TonB-dependent siderophore receptor n=1 Tax=Massilia glaciei TaxID=1524097 RepID=A0A2U2HIE1_9BURK|nr:TonB-dependent siderophore receptor [Massilia glaciei]PWF46112.1 TonB-dependent siderophore receptor [Massilia glaciei]